MIDCGVIAWVKLSVTRNFLKVKWEGIKGLSQTFILHLWSSWIQILFKYKTLERRWHDFFHLFKWKGLLKIFEFHLKIFSTSETLCNSMIFMREDKMTSSNYMKYELGVSKISNLKLPLKLFSIWSNLCFIQIIFLQK